MKTLTIKIPDQEFLRFGLKSETINFEEFVKEIKIRIAKEAMLNSQSIAEEVGLSELTEEQIDVEIRELRDTETRD